MPKLILTRGVPGSGKSTWAKEWVREDPDNRVRVNRDDLRNMLYAATETRLGYAQEENVTAVERSIATIALNSGKDVVVDAMNLRDKWVKGWYTLGYPVDFIDFEVTLDTALVLNGLRPNRLPDEVVKRIWSTLTVNGKLRPAPVVEPVLIEPYTPPTGGVPAYIFDIDGTLAHMRGRGPHDYEKVSTDVADPHVVHLLKELARTHYIVVLSGRPESCRADTEVWLRRNGIFSDHLFMRTTGDYRPDQIIKAELFDKHVRDIYNVHGVIDDRNRVVAMWRSLGLKCFQAQEGAF